MLKKFIAWFSEESAWEQRLKQSRDSYENLLLSYIKLVNQKDKN